MEMDSRTSIRHTMMASPIWRWNSGMGNHHVTVWCGSPCTATYHDCHTYAKTHMQEAALPGQMLIMRTHSRSLEDRLNSAPQARCPQP